MQWSKGTSRIELSPWGTGGTPWVSLPLKKVTATRDSDSSRSQVWLHWCSWRYSKNYNHFLHLIITNNTFIITKIHKEPANWHFRRSGCDLKETSFITCQEAKLDDIVLPFLVSVRKETRRHCSFLPSLSEGSSKKAAKPQSRFFPHSLLTGFRGKWYIKT